MVLTATGTIAHTIKGSVRRNGSASGSYRAKIVLHDKAGGAEVGTCDTGTVRWRARSARGRVYAGATSQGPPMVIELDKAGFAVASGAAWAALGRIYTTLGDAAGEGRVLARRIDASARSSRPPPDGDLLYRLAGARLSNSEDLDGALDLLERALGLAPDFERALGTQ